MNTDCLSNVAKDYLDTFDAILDTMIREMTEAELGNSISDNFMVQMIPHHQAAIDMSNNILRFTTDLTLQGIAEQIVETQTRSIENMKQILCICETYQNPRNVRNLYQSRMNMIIQTMFRRMKESRASNRINCDFISEMIPHHEGAVAMSQVTLAYPICQELRPILQAIIVSQKRGIEQMRKLWRHLGC